MGGRAVEELGVCHDTVLPSCPSTENKLYGRDFQGPSDRHHQSQQWQTTFAYIMASQAFEHGRSR